MTSAKDIVLNAWKTFATRDADRIAALFTDDAEWIAPKGNATAVALDHADHMIGAQQIARFIAQKMHKMFSQVDIAFRGVYARRRCRDRGGADAREASRRQAVRERLLLRIHGGGDADPQGAGIHGYAQGMADGVRR
ncbi:hypothetical protein ACVWXO_007755 [Bradyrhizobium sp. LM2.7]